MYRNRRSNSFGKRNGAFSAGNFRGRKDPRRRLKTLNPSLFIKKAVENSEPTETLTNTLFSSYDIAEKLKRNVLDHGYTKTTPIQEQTIPDILNGRDIIGIANTGTGKTAAFLVPLIDKVYKDRNERVLIITPTRELAVQINDELKIFDRGMGMETALIIGGANMRRQIYTLRHNPQFVIGTPGRLMDLLERRILNLSLFQNIVLDEVDRMVDIGFLKTVHEIITRLPKNRQSLFFSATVDGKTRDILRDFVSNPVTVSVKNEDTAENIDQDVIKIGNKDEKVNILHDLLILEEFRKVLVFGRTKWGMEKLSKNLVERGFRVAAIHGNKSQNQRQRALDDFRDNRIHILLATDVVSRGIDVDDITHVINYDAPESYEDYIHRIGRTGRAGKKGVALTFVE
jgi:ATP-dependent RNA helicase RhlE